MRGNKKVITKVKKSTEKSKSNRLERDKLKRKVKDLYKSREKWKEKYKTKQQEIKVLEKGLTKYEKRIKKLEGSNLKIKRHQYSASQIQMCVNLRCSTNSSLRSCVQIIKVLSVIIGLEFFRPSISSIRNWEMKMGYHQLQKRDHSKGDWVLILDESIMVGQQKLLLLMGVNLSNYDFNSPLNFSHAQVLGLHVGSSCKWTEIKQAIDNLLSRGYQLKYAVSDSGSSICKALRESGIVRIEDCTHALGLLLKKRYKNNACYDTFCKEATSFKRKISTSKYAAYMPPTQRSKARFLNLTQMSNWATKLLRVAKNKDIEKEVYDRIKWIESYENLIIDIVKHQQLLNQLFKVLKHKGLSKRNQQACKKVLDQSEVEESFKEKIREYLKSNIDKLPKEKQLICCSDIIESKFGHFKNQMSNNKNVGFTASSLTIANSNIIKDLDQIKTSMEETKLADIAVWEKQNLKDSLLKRKNQVFKNAV